jgi:putative acetyltransferase
VLIRRERSADEAAVRAVVAAAFATPDGAEPVEVRLLDALRICEQWLPRLSLVAEGPDHVVSGHVVCSRAWVGELPVVALGPLAVLPEAQQHGVGTALVHAVLGAADALDVPLVALLGHADYYPRFGFGRGDELGVQPPDPGWGAHFQVRPLTAWSSSAVGGFRYAEPFRDLG